MMTILKDMGVQQWRLRRSAAEIQLDAKSPDAVESNVGLIASVALSDKPSVAVDHHVERSIWPKELAHSNENRSDSGQAKIPQNDNVEIATKDPIAELAPKSVPTELIKASNNNPSKPNKPNGPKAPVSMPQPMPAPMPGPGLTPAPMPLVGVMSDPGEPTADFQAPEPLLEDYGYTDIASEAPVSEPTSTAVGSLANATWDDLHALVNSWQNCPTCSDGKSLLGHGNINADWLFISDAPSSAEIAQQYLFAGRSGQLFEAILGALGMQRQSVYTTSLFKCVASDDMSVIPACDNILQRQIQLLQPKVIVTFGEFTAQSLLKANANLDILRSQEQRCINSKVVVVPTFTPAQMLDDSRLKSKVWGDLKKAIIIANMPT